MLLRSIGRRFAGAPAYEDPAPWQTRLARIAVAHKKVIPPVIPEKEILETFPDLAPVKPVKGSVRTGLMAYKVGHIGLYDEWGQRHVTTVAKVYDCYVTRVRTIAKDGYEALQLSAGTKPVTEAKKVELGQYIKLGIRPKQDQCEFRVSSENLLPLGKTHGTTKGVNNPGATSQGKSVGKVWKYKKMDGHRGPDPRTVNCKIFRTETARDLIFLRGLVPGAVGDLIKISDARGKTSLKNRHIRLPYPTFVPRPGVEYPVTVQEPPLDRDPFLFPDKVVKEKRVKA
jgi:large subunit ribosomal protein L3